MATKRGRSIASMGQAFGPLGNVDGSFTPGVQGQPVMVRMQGVPTMAGYRDRVPRWNMAQAPDWLRRTWQAFQSRASWEPGA